MKRLLLLLLALLAAGAAQAAERHFTLLQVNDVYQLGADQEGLGGLPRIAALKHRLFARDPNTLLVLSGDTLSPSIASGLFHGRQMIDGWNAAGLDYAVFGNHEFDFGPKVLAERVGESHFTWLASNVSVEGKPLGASSAYVVRELDGIKVGFIGLLTPATATLSHAAGVRIDDPLTVARGMAETLHAQGVDVIVALTHESMAEDRTLAASGSVDLILGGHEHRVIEQKVDGVWILKLGPLGHTAGEVRVSVAGPDAPPQVRYEVVQVDASVPSDTATAKVVGRYMKAGHKALGEVVGFTQVPLEGRDLPNRRGETNLGDFIADLYRQATGAQAALVNGGDIRLGRVLPAGAFTRADLLAMLPFDNPVVVLEIDGATLRAAVEHGLARVNVEPDAGRFPQISGLRLVYDPSRPPGQRVRELKLDGRPVEPKAVYTLATNSYLAEGGDGYTMLTGLKRKVNAEFAATEIQILSDAIAHGPIAPATEGRIVRLAPMVQ